MEVRVITVLLESQASTYRKIRRTMAWRESAAYSARDYLPSLTIKERCAREIYPLLMGEVKDMSRLGLVNIVLEIMVSRYLIFLRSVDGGMPNFLACIVQK